PSYPSRRDESAPRRWRRRARRPQRLARRRRVLAPAAAQPPQAAGPVFRRKIHTFRSWRRKGPRRPKLASCESALLRHRQELGKRFHQPRWIGEDPQRRTVLAYHLHPGLGERVEVAGQRIVEERAQVDRRQRGLLAFGSPLEALDDLADPFRLALDALELRPL